jgi:hypothetical protein
MDTAVSAQIIPTYPSMALEVQNTLFMRQVHLDSTVHEPLH